MAVQKNASQSDAAHAERRDGIKRLVSEESAFYTQIGVGCLDVNVEEEFCDVLWSAAVRRNQFVRDVDWGCSASVMRKHGLLAYDGSMEAGSGFLHTKGRHDSSDSGGSAQYKSRTCISRVFNLTWQTPGCRSIDQGVTWSTLKQLGKRSLRLRDLSRVRLKALACLLCRSPAVWAAL